MPKPMIVERPLVLVFRQPDGTVMTHLYPAPGDTYEGYGLLVCDLIRHVACAFKVDEADVWEWVEKEYRHPTTPIIVPS